MSVNRRDFLRSVASISGATIASAVALGQMEQTEQLDPRCQILSNRASSMSWL